MSGKKIGVAATRIRVTLSRYTLLGTPTIYQYQMKNENTLRPIHSHIWPMYNFTINQYQMKSQYDSNPGLHTKGNEKDGHESSDCALLNGIL